MAATTVSAAGLDYYSANLFLDSPVPHAEQGDSLDKALADLPAGYHGERVWSGPDVSRKQDEWITSLSEQDHVHIIEGLRHFQMLDLQPEALSPETFPLPQDLSNRLRAISQDCYNGRGFGVLRGLCKEVFSDEENVVVFGGVSSHVARVRGFQDMNRELVTCHVISEDTQPGVMEQDLRPAFTNGRLSFHTDLGDVLALYVMEGSSDGGQTMIASSSMIYNELASTRPDLLQELSKPWAFFSTQNYETDGTPLIINVDGDKLVFQFSRLPITGFRNKGANPTLPRPTAKRLEAMSYVEALAWKHSLPLPTKRGDIAYINNMSLLHARSAFDLDSDGKPLPSKRHLVKLMLRDPELTWKLPHSLNWYSELVYGSNRDDGGRSEKWALSWHSRPEGYIWAGTGPPGSGPHPGSPPGPPKPLSNG